MRKTKRTILIAMLICVVTVPSCSAGSAGAKARPHFSTAGELLDNYAETQDKLQSFIIKAEDSCETRSSFFRNEKEKKKTHYSCELRFDGSRVSYRTYQWGDFGFGSDLVHKDNPRYRGSTWDGNDYFRYLKSPAPTACPYGKVQIYHSRKYAEKLIQRRGYRGSSLSGYFNDQRIDSILRQADTISVREKMHQAGKAGSQCYVIDAVTKYGTYTVWIDPEHGYNISKARVQRKTGDILFDQRLTGKGEAWHLLDNVSFEKIDNVWLPMQADIQGGRVYADGNFHETVSHHKRIEVILNPDHDALGSFSPNDVQNGAIVYITGVKGKTYRWRDGQVVDKSGSKVVFDSKSKKVSRR